MAEVAAGIALVAGIAKAYGSYQSGKVQQKMYNIRGRQARIAADQQSVNERRKGLAVLQKISAHAAAINARSAAGSIDAFSGTPAVFQQFAVSEGFQDYKISKTNSSILETMGVLQEIDNRQAGAMAAYQGRIKALTQIGQAAASFAMLGGPSSGGGGMPGGTLPGYTSIGPAAGTGGATSSAEVSF